jgi:hypothetical protein
MLRPKTPIGMMVLVTAAVLATTLGSRAVAQPHPEQRPPQDDRERSREKADGAPASERAQPERGARRMQRPGREAPAAEPRRPHQRRSEEARAEPPAARPSAVRFEASVFMLDVNADKVLQLDAESLARDISTLAAFGVRLGEYGEARLLYRVDQILTPAANGGRIQTTRSTPYVTGARAVEGGRMATSVGREQVGARFDVGGFAMAGPAARMFSVEVDISAVTPSGVDVGADRKAPVMWDVTQQFTGPVQMGQPLVLLSLDGQVDADGADPIAFVTLIRLTSPEIEAH